MSGIPVFRGTRVPIQNLFDCIEEGETIDQFLEQFPTVTREQVNGVLELSKERLLEGEVAAWRMCDAPPQTRICQSRGPYSYVRLKPLMARALEALETMNPRDVVVIQE